MSVHGSVLGAGQVLQPGNPILGVPVQLRGLVGEVQLAAHSERRNTWEGKLQDETCSKRLSSRV